MNTQENHFFEHMPKMPEHDCNSYIESNMCKPYCRVCKKDMSPTPHESSLHTQQRVEEVVEEFFRKHGNADLQYKSEADAVED